MEELNGRQNVMVGIIAGCIQCGLDHPLITLKNMVQQSLPLSFNPRILYRGTIADMIGLSSLTAIQFFGTGAIKSLILQNKRLASSIGTKKETVNLCITPNEMLISSLGGGMLSGIVCSPWELIMIQQQRFGGNLLHNLSKISTQNLTLLTRGMIPAMCREGIFTMGYLGITPLLEMYQLQYQRNENENINMMNKFLCAMISGVFATICSHPFDTVKTCMQGDLQQAYFKGTYQSFKYLYTHYGMKRIYAGASFRFGTVVMAFFVFNRVMEFVAPKMYWQSFQEYHRNKSSRDENRLFNVTDY